MNKSIAQPKSPTTQTWEQIMGVDTKISSQYSTRPQALEASKATKFSRIAKSVRPRVSRV